MPKMFNSASEKLQFYIDVLTIFIDYGPKDMFCWNESSDGIVFFITCNDFFYWAFDDAEAITPDNLSLLKDTIKEVESLYENLPDECYKDFDPEEWSLFLFCARSRKQRPQLAYYTFIPVFLRPLFDACGLEEDQYGTEAFERKHRI